MRKFCTENILRVLISTNTFSERTCSAKLDSVGTVFEWRHNKVLYVAMCKFYAAQEVFSFYSVTEIFHCEHSNEGHYTEQCTCKFTVYSSIIPEWKL